MYKQCQQCTDLKKILLVLYSKIPQKSLKPSFYLQLNIFSDLERLMPMYCRYVLKLHFIRLITITNSSKKEEIVGTPKKEQCLRCLIACKVRGQ